MRHRDHQLGHPLRGAASYGTLSGIRSAPAMAASALAPWAGAALAGPLGGDPHMFALPAALDSPPRCPRSAHPAPRNDRMSVPHRHNVVVIRTGTASATLNGAARTAKPAVAEIVRQLQEGAF
ncbi:hypothetical protein [Yinghuangia soli]|uniref:hypothetical protein n=1 Tax=Yinghuangia soli TaxID=2908204 RepID=UPI0022860438|nr:hypothetical protein [Yinghuangia soli]